jgi:hypothetical protein
LLRLHADAGQILKAALDVGALSVSEARQLLGAGVDADDVIRQLPQQAFSDEEATA